MGLKRCPCEALGRPASPGPMWTSCFIHCAMQGCSSCPSWDEWLWEGLASVSSTSSPFSLLQECVNTKQKFILLGPCSFQAWPVSSLGFLVFFTFSALWGPCNWVSSPTPLLLFENVTSSGFGGTVLSWAASVLVLTSSPTLALLSQPMWLFSRVPLPFLSLTLPLGRFKSMTNFGLDVPNLLHWEPLNQTLHPNTSSVEYLCLEVP